VRRFAYNVIKFNTANINVKEKGKRKKEKGRQQAQFQQGTPPFSIHINLNTSCDSEHYRCDGCQTRPGSTEIPDPLVLDR
jgi:hypothetical protein